VNSLDERVAAYARLVLGIGVNMQSGQTLVVNCLIAHASFAQVLAAEAYRAGARYVDVYYSDHHLRRVQAELGPDESLSWSPPWLVQRVTDLAAEGGALLTIGGNPEPELLADLDGARVGRTRMHDVLETTLHLTDGRCNWAVIAVPTEGWARTVLGEPDVEGLWNAVEACVRLDEPDPVAAWRDHLERLDVRAETLNARRFDALRYRGPGTDLTVGLHPDSTWIGAREVSRGIEHVPNMPTEEVFTTPDARRVEGSAATTYPLELAGTLVRGLAIRFEHGEAVEIRAEEGEDVVRTHLSSDRGARRLGEVALVDRTSRVGRTGLVFHNTLFDENAASHLAFGAAFPQAVAGAAAMTPAERQTRGINESGIHTDIMIGSPEVAVSGVTRDGREVAILRGGRWSLGAAR
jgi:aminopeptidase